MKKYIFLLMSAIVLMLPKMTAAENIIQLTGGNYIFAEDGRLTFNIEHQNFINRNWVYNAQSGGAETLFRQRMDFRTRHSSDFHAYEQAARRGGFVYAVYNGKNGGRYQKVFWPVVFQGIVRVGAWVGRWVVPKAVSWCIKSLNCKTVSGVLAAHLCVFNYSGNFLGLPAGICNAAEEEGFEKNGEGEYERPASGEYWEVRYYEYPCNGSCDYKMSKRFNNRQSALDFGMEKSLEFLDEQNAAERERRKYDVTCKKKQTIKVSDSLYYSGCSTSDGGGVYMAVGLKKQDKPVKLTMVDIEQFALQDFKKNPNAYINDKGPLGKKIRESIQPTQGDINTKGTLSIVSSPYRDSSGQTKQDIVTVDAPSTWSAPKKGGDISTPTAGVSVTSNNITVKTIDRPDKEDESKPAKDNDPNNGKGSSGGSGSGNDGEQGERCVEGSDNVGCAKMGDVDENGQGFEIPQSTNNTTWQADYFLPATAVCPAPKVVAIRGTAYELKYDQVCSFAEKIRYIVIAMATLIAGFIVFGRKN